MAVRLVSEDVEFWEVEEHQDDEKVWEQSVDLDMARIRNLCDDGDDSVDEYGYLASEEESEEEEIESKSELEQQGVENESTEHDRVCRICFDGASEELISPCLCSGSCAFVHRSCLDCWRASGSPEAATACVTCGFKFVVQPGHEEEQVALTWYEWTQEHAFLQIGIAIFALLYAASSMSSTASFFVYFRWILVGIGLPVYPCVSMTWIEAIRRSDLPIIVSIHAPALFVHLWPSSTSEPILWQAARSVLEMCAVLLLLTYLKPFFARSSPHDERGIRSLPPVASLTQRSCKN